MNVSVEPLTRTQDGLAALGRFLRDAGQTTDSKSPIVIGGCLGGYHDGLPDVTDLLCQLNRPDDLFGDPSLTIHLFEKDLLK
ncbi:hypothetical protein Ciccas_004892 [Cichlidogyrus casuarinus]|uniref:Uncharacterized protein n=1 Tax=Cichlidogyrus casuarinus TaxID=1844966 RepID=A0ABD2QAM8_9PLAT